MKNYIKLKPDIDPTAYVSPGAVIIGKVKIGRHSSVWPNAVIRADINEIIIGDYTNIQDGSILHVADDCRVKIGNYVTVGHNANLHGCLIEDNALIGIGAMVLNGAVLKKGSQVGAGAVVTGSSVVSKNTLVLGMPAKFARKLTKKELKDNLKWAVKYSKLKEKYKETG